MDLTYAVEIVGKSNISHANTCHVKKFSKRNIVRIKCVGTALQFCMTYTRVYW